MSYFYFVKDQEKNQTTLTSIVENENDQQYHATDNMDIVEVSNDDFIKVKTTSYEITGYDGSNFTYFHHDPTQNPNPNDSNAEFVQNYINSIISEIDKWLALNPSHAKVNEWTTYKNFLSSFDPNSITYPLESSVEQYFQDNSMSYKSLLELPTK
jgi:hypothetical protein|tara:strand:- start:4998 stop:5462 length:465 start_codon:yes stop_codon:yes gene_type:complete